MQFSYQTLIRAPSAAGTSRGSSAPRFALRCPGFQPVLSHVCAALPQVFGVSSSTAKGGGGSLHLGRPPGGGSFPAVYEDVGALWPFAGAAVSRFYSSARDSPPPLPSCFFRLGFGMELREWGRGGGATSPSFSPVSRWVGDLNWAGGIWGFPVVPVPV